jgi:uncharacterized protein
MANWFRCVLPMCLMLLWAGTVLANGASGIQVTGRGEAWVEPDVARFQFEVVRQGADASVLKRELDDIVREVLTLADRLQIAERDVTAAAIQVMPNYRHQNGRTFIDGVTVRRNLKVTLRDLDQYQALVDGVLASGINQIHSVELDMAEPGALQRQALDVAIEDALREARHVADQFGMRLGPVVEINVDTRPAQPFPVTERIMMRAVEDSIRPGRISAERTVNARFALLER